MKYLLVILMSPILCLAQDDCIEKYLKASQTIDLSSSKATIKNMSFDEDDILNILSYKILGSETFETDIKNVIGYRYVLLLDVKKGAGNNTEEKYIATLYFDKQAKNWKVFGINKPADACEEARLKLENISKGEFYTDKVYVYRNAGYWQMQCGKILEAEKSFLLSSEYGKKENAPTASAKYLEAIRRIK